MNWKQRRVLHALRTLQIDSGVECVTAIQIVGYLEEQYPDSWFVYRFPIFKSQFGLTRAGIYKCLSRAERQGLLHSYWCDGPGDTLRRGYRLTEQGRWALA